MPKSLEDKVEERARQKFRNMLSSAGVHEANIDLEILFLLPVEFVRMYHQLYDQAYGEVLRSPGGGGRDEGRVKRSGQAKGKGSQMKTRKMSGATAGGKRFTERRELVKSEAAMTVKVRLDRKLVRAAEAALRDVVALREKEKQDEVGAGANLNGDPKPAVPSDSSPNRTEIGNSPGTDPSGGGTSQYLSCPDCGTIQSPRWKRCPFHP